MSEQVGNKQAVSVYNFPFDFVNSMYSEQWVLFI